MNSSAVLRFVAGIYIIYLAYNILGAVMRGETEGNPTLLVIAAIVFIVLGIVIIILGYREMKRVKADSEEDMWADEEENAIETTEDTTEEVENEKETADE